MEERMRKLRVVGQFLRRHLPVGLLLILWLAIYFALRWRDGPTIRHQGTITGFRQVESRWNGGLPRAFVRLGNGKTVVVQTRNDKNCKVGAGIEVLETPVAIGTRYSAGPMNCSADVIPAT